MVIALILAFNVFAQPWITTSTCRWAIISSPNETANDGLSAIGADSATDVWTVGWATKPNNAPLPLVARSVGGNFEIVSGPNLGQGGALDGVAPLSSSDVWTAGYQYVNNAPQTLVEHWDGKSLTIVSTPNVSGLDQLAGISATSASQIWAVGDSGNVPTIRTLIELWDGHMWSVVPSQNAGAFYNVLSAVSARTSTDAWAAGYYSKYRRTGVSTLIEHWNGAAWSIVPSPNPSGGADAKINGISAIAGDNAWAVGAYEAGRATETALIEHWNGRAWKIFTSPTFSDQSWLNAVSMSSPTDGWAVGNIYEGDNTVDPLIEHWNGRMWSFVASPDNGAQPYLFGVSAISPSEALVAGYHMHYQSLLERYQCGR